MARISPATLVASLASLHQIDLERDFTVALQRVVTAAQELFQASGAGLMLLEEGESLRWASATDQRAQTLETFQEQLGKGPVMRAFLECRPAVIRDVATDAQVAEVAGELRHAGIHATLSVPVELQGGPIGTVEVYSEAPRDWDDSEIGALQAYAGVVASLLAHAVGAHAEQALTRQLKLALGHRVLIEQAKGVLMERNRVDARTAFEHLRAAARSSGRRLTVVADQVVATAGEPAS
jgi:GAF domain-containing protein